MESKKKEIEVRELAEQFFEEAVNQLDDQERKEEVEAERETYIGVWMRGYRAGEAAPAAGREEDAVEFAKWLDKERNQGSPNWKDMKIWGKETAFKLMYELFKQKHNP